MQINLSFNPTEDKRDEVVAVVDAVYGVKLSPKSASVAPIMAASAPVTPSQVVAPTTVGSIVDPNVTPAPTAAVLAGPATSTPASVSLDKNGVPWDVRIHSGGLNEDGTHKQNKDGTWSKKKGVDDLTFSNITKELQNLMASKIGDGAAPVGLPPGGVLGNPVNVPHQEAVPLPTDPNSFVVASPAPTMTVATPTIAPMPEPTALAPTIAPMPVPPPQPAAAPTDYASLAVWLAPNLEESGGKLKREHVEYFCRQCQIVDGQGVGQFALVANRPDAVAWLYQSFVAQLAAL